VTVTEEKANKPGAVTNVTRIIGPPTSGPRRDYYPKRLSICRPRRKHAIVGSKKKNDPEKVVIGRGQGIRRQGTTEAFLTPGLGSFLNQKEESQPNMKKTLKEGKGERKEGGEWRVDLISSK